MKVLYAIQGTGNGHLSRAEEIVPLLNKYVDTMVEVKVINPTIYVSGLMKVLTTMVSEEKTSKITVLDDRPYSILQFI